MIVNDVVVRVGGESGEGIITLGEVITFALARAAFEIYTFRTYPAEIKGGYAMFQVRARDRVLLSRGDRPQVLVAMNEEAYRENRAELEAGAVLIHDPADFQVDGTLPGGVTAYQIPFKKIATALGSTLVKNIVAFGAVARLLGIPEDACTQVLKRRYAKKGNELMVKNQEAFRAGAAYVGSELEKRDPYLLKASGKPQEKLLLSGNQALSLGALYAGVRIYAGYPITPATDIMEWMAAVLPRYGGHVIQTEDEIAALGVVLGASYAGRKAMTATAGPGLSLMVEMLGLAGMAEIPAVIVDVQRAGPSTGMPTKTEQGDLNLALYGAHGEIPRIVLAPSSVEDCFYTAVRAFNLAERYQVPVLVLSDQSLGHRLSTVPAPDLSVMTVEERRRPTADELGTYARYRFTESGISPMAIPGMAGGYYPATGIEHDEAGAPNYDPQHRVKIMAKRMGKIAGAARFGGNVRRYGADQAEVGIIGWGSTEGVIRDAVEQLTAQGITVAAIHPKILHPLPLEELGGFLKSVKRVLVPELNFSGQFANLLRIHFETPLVRFTKVDGLPFAPHEIVDKVKEMIGNHDYTRRQQHHLKV